MAVTGSFSGNKLSDATKFIAIGLLTVSGVWARLNDFEEPRSATLMYHDILEAFLCTSWILGSALSIVSVLENSQQTRANALLEIGPIWLISSFQIFRLLLSFVLALRHGYLIHKAQTSASEFIRAYYKLVEGVRYPDSQLRLTIDYSLAESRAGAAKDFESSSADTSYEFVWRKLDIHSFARRKLSPSDVEDGRNSIERTPDPIIKSEGLECREHRAQDWQGEFVRIEAATQPKTILGKGRLDRNPYSQTPIAALTYTKQRPMLKRGGKRRSHLGDLVSKERGLFTIIRNVESTEYSMFVESLNNWSMRRLERICKRQLADLEAWLRRSADMTISAALWKNRATIVAQECGSSRSFAGKADNFSSKFSMLWTFVRENVSGSFLFSVELFLALLSFVELAVINLFSLLHRRRLTHALKKAENAITRNESLSAVLREYCMGFLHADRMGWRISSDTRANLLNVALEVRDVIFWRALSDAFIFDALCTEGAGEKDFVYRILVVTMHDTMVTLVNSTEERRQHQLVWDALSSTSNVYVVMQDIKKHLMLYVEVPANRKLEVADWHELLIKALKGLIPMRVRWPSFGAPGEFQSDGKQWRKIDEDSEEKTISGLARSIRDTFKICPSALSATNLVERENPVLRLVLSDSGSALALVSTLLEPKAEARNVGDGSAKPSRTVDTRASQPLIHTIDEDHLVRTLTVSIDGYKTPSDAREGLLRLVNSGINLSAKDQDRRMRENLTGEVLRVAVEAASRARAQTRAKKFVSELLHPGKHVIIVSPRGLPPKRRVPKSHSFTFGTEAEERDRRAQEKGRRPDARRDARAGSRATPAGSPRQVARDYAAGAGGQARHGKATDAEESVRLRRRQTLQPFSISISPRGTALASPLRGEAPPPLRLD